MEVAGDWECEIEKVNPVSRKICIFYWIREYYILAGIKSGRYLDEEGR